MLRSAEGGTMFIVLPEKLPERFTVEAVYHSSDSQTTLSSLSHGWRQFEHALAATRNSACVDAESKSGSTAYKETSARDS